MIEQARLRNLGYHLMRALTSKRVSLAITLLNLAFLLAFLYNPQQLPGPALQIRRSEAEQILSEGLSDSTQRATAAVYALENYTTENARHMHHHGEALEVAALQLLSVAKADPAVAQNGLLAPLVEDLYDSIHKQAAQSRQLTRDTFSAQVGVRKHLSELADTVGMARHKLALHVAALDENRGYCNKQQLQQVLNQYVNKPLKDQAEFLTSPDSPFGTLGSLAHSTEVLEGDLGNVIGKVKRLTPEMQQEEIAWRSNSVSLDFVAVQHQIDADHSWFFSGHHAHKAAAARSAASAQLAKSRNLRDYVKGLYDLHGSLSLVRQVFAYNVMQNRQILQELDSVRLLLLKAADFASPEYLQICVMTLGKLEHEFRQAADVLALKPATKLFGNKLPAAATVA